MKMETNFHINDFNLHIYPRFGKEARDNSEMAYYLLINAFISDYMYSRNSDIIKGKLKNLFIVSINRQEILKPV